MLFFTTTAHHTLISSTKRASNDPFYFHPNFFLIHPDILSCSFHNIPLIILSSQSIHSIPNIGRRQPAKKVNFYKKNHIHTCILAVCKHLTLTQHCWLNQHQSSSSADTHFISPTWSNICLLESTPYKQ